MDNYQFYMKANVDEYIGQWVAILKQKVIAHGHNVKEVFRKAKEKYPKETPLVVRVPDKETMIV